jgi:hypothetical protein
MQTIQTVLAAKCSKIIEFTVSATEKNITTTHKPVAFSYVLCFAGARPEEKEEGVCSCAIPKEAQQI